MSLTIGSVVTMILSQFLPLEEVSPFVDAVILVVTTVLIWYGRWRVGDITWWGGRK